MPRRVPVTEERPDLARPGRCSAGIEGNSLIAREGPGDRVVGLLMGEYGLTEPEAFRWIRHRTIDHRTTMKGVRPDWDPDLF